MPHLCVSMCTYQGAAFLEDQLASILAQRRRPDSMVIVDDGSVDATQEIAGEFADYAPFPVQVRVNPANLGFVRNFERAISLAEGDVIVLADQGDIWREDRLERVERVFSEAPEVAFVFSDADLVDDALRPLGERLSDAIGFSPEAQRSARAGRLFEVLVRGNVVTGTTMAFRSRFRPLLLPLVDGVEHDAWIALILSAIAPAVYLDEPLVRYRQHGGNAIGARRLGIAGRVMRARDIRTDGLASQRRRNEAALTRLANVPLSTSRREVLREAAAHLRVRSSLPDSRLRRLVPVVRELTGGRYRLSRGIASALRDLIA